MACRIACLTSVTVRAVAERSSDFSLAKACSVGRVGQQRVNTIIQRQDWFQLECNDDRRLLRRQNGRADLFGASVIV